MSKGKTRTEGDGRQLRRRLRGYLGTKEGKAVGFTSIAVPVIGFILNDLKKPDSIVRRLTTTAVNRLLEHRQTKSTAVDITDRVEVTTNNDKGAEGATDRQ